MINDFSTSSVSSVIFLLYFPSFLLSGIPFIYGFIDDIGVLLILGDKDEVEDRNKDWDGDEGIDGDDNDNGDSGLNKSDDETGILIRKEK